MEKRVVDIVIIGAGASGMMAAYFCALSGKSVIVLDHNKKIGRKILISGGGKCNFTNRYGESNDYYSENSHFVKSALSRFTGWDFLELVKRHKIKVEERKFGQLFCLESAKEINRMLLELTDRKNIEILLEQKDLQVKNTSEGYEVFNNRLTISALSLVIATGGLVLPQIGASDFGHKLAKKYGHKIIPMVPALVPFIVDGFSELAGNAFEAKISVNGHTIREPVLFTHKGFSGPCILKTSLFWNHGDSIIVDWLPDKDLEIILKEIMPNTSISKVLKRFLPNKFVDIIFDKIGLDDKTNVGGISKPNTVKLVEAFKYMNISPSGTEGFRKAETTRGGVDTSKISSKTMESQLQPRLYFVGEVLDVAGQLGGHNFQWCWASAHAVGEALS